MLRYVTLHYITCNACGLCEFSRIHVYDILQSNIIVTIVFLVDIICELSFCQLTGSSSVAAAPTINNGSIHFTKSAILFSGLCKS